MISSDSSLTLALSFSLSLCLALSLSFSCSFWCSSSLAHPLSTSFSLLFAQVFTPSTLSLFLANPLSLPLPLSLSLQLSFCLFRLCKHSARPYPQLKSKEERWRVWLYLLAVHGLRYPQHQPSLWTSHDCSLFSAHRFLNLWLRLVNSSINNPKFIFHPTCFFFSASAASLSS